MLGILISVSCLFMPFIYLIVKLHGIRHACGRGMTYTNPIDCDCMIVFGSNTINASMNHLPLSKS